jgi:hypothetical protein
VSLSTQNVGAAARNPGKTSGGIGAAVAVLITLGVSFGLPISLDQQSAILGAVAVIVPLVVGWWADRRTTPYVDPRNQAGQQLRPAPGPTTSPNAEQPAGPSVNGIDVP